MRPLNTALVTIAIILAICGLYIITMDGGRLNFLNIIEIESNKKPSTQHNSENSKPQSKGDQNATSNGSGNAVNSNNGATVSIEK